MNLENATLERLLQTARAAALRAGEVIVSEFDQPQTIRTKDGPRDVVTDADEKAQAAALNVIHQHHPEHHILAEESAGDDLSIPDGITWIIDPIDGTTNFTRNVPLVSVSVGVAVDGQPVAGAVYDPLRREIYLGGRGIGVTVNGQPVQFIRPRSLADSLIGFDWSHVPANRQKVLDTVMALGHHCRTIRGLGSAALGLAYVAAGRLGVYANFGLKPWDICAAAAMILTLGGDLRRPDGTDWGLGDSMVLAGHPALLDETFSYLL